MIFWLTSLQETDVVTLTDDKNKRPVEKSMFTEYMRTIHFSKFNKLLMLKH